MPCNRQRTERANAILGAMKGRGAVSYADLSGPTGLTVGEFSVAIKYLERNGIVRKAGRDPKDVRRFLWVIA